MELDIEQVRNYLNGTLPDDQRKEIDRKLQSDPQYAREFEDQKVIIESINHFYRGELKKKLQTRDREIGVRRVKTVSMRRWWAMAAAVMLLAVSGYFLFFYSADPGELFDQYYKPYYNVLDGSVRNGETISSPGLVLYDEGKYQAAAIALGEELEQNPGDAGLTFYQGLCYLETNEYSAAIDNLRAVSQMETHVLQQPAQWYLGLTYLKANQPNAAATVFQSIRDSTSSYREQAAEILDQLN